MLSYFCSTARHPRPWIYAGPRRVLTQPEKKSSNPVSGNSTPGLAFPGSNCERLACGTSCNLRAKGQFFSMTRQVAAIDYSCNPHRVCAALALQPGAPSFRGASEMSEVNQRFDALVLAAAGYSKLAVRDNPCRVKASAWLAKRRRVQPGIPSPQSVALCLQTSVQVADGLCGTYMAHSLH